MHKIPGALEEEGEDQEDEEATNEEVVVRITGPSRRSRNPRLRKYQQQT